MSDFWLKKMRTYFQRIDFDKDGSITRADFEGMAKRVIETGKLNADQEKDIMTTLTNVWDKYLKAAGGGDGITQEKFIAAMATLVHDPSLKDTLQGPLPLFFHAVDANNDKLISMDEFKLYFSIFDLKPEMAEASFQAIDDNHDGDISLEEFLHNGSEFFLEEKDESLPSKLFWGPLLEA